MSSTLLALFLFFASACPQNLSDLIRDYHRLVGIPIAQRIKAIEDVIHSNENSRMFWAKTVMIKKYPFFAGLVIRHKNSYIFSACGASLVSSSRLVTAAHCWESYYDPPPAELEVVLGSEYLFTGGLRIKSPQTEISIHPKFNKNIFEHDVAVISLPDPVTFKENIFPISLPMDDELTLSFEGFPGSVVGIGFHENETLIRSFYDSFEGRLRGVVSTIISDVECTQTYKEEASGNMCTRSLGRKGLCLFDAGGPLVVYNLNNGLRKILVGIAIIKEPDRSGTKIQTFCGTETPSLYARISENMDFIKAHVTIPIFTFKYNKRGKHNYEEISVLEGNFWRSQIINEDYGMLDLESCDS